MCFNDEGEYPRLSNCRRPVARIEHKCNECGGVIAKGERYFYGSWLYDDFFTIKSCRRCEFDRFLIHVEELKEGCREWESWCPYGVLLEEMANRDMKRTKAQDVPPNFCVKEMKLV